MTSVVRWSSLCDTDPEVALAYYAVHTRYVDLLAGCADRGDVDVVGISALSRLSGVLTSGVFDGGASIVGGSLLDVSGFQEADDAGRLGGRSSVHTSRHGGEASCECGGDVSASSVGIDCPVVDGGVRPVGLDSAVSGRDSSCVGRGRWWAKNRAKRDKKKQNRFLSSDVSIENVPEWRRKNPNALLHSGVFVECSDEKRRELRESRADMLVVKNKLELEKYAAALRKAEAVRVARTDELEFEMNRLKLEDERRKMIEKRLAELPAGYAETLASAGIVSDIPSLSSGSVSPNSSISMAEFHEMQKQVADLKEQIAFDAAEFTEAKVKLMSQLSMKTEEIEKLKKKNAGVRDRVDVRVVIPDGEFDVIQSEADVTFDDGFHGRGSAVIRQELKKLRIHEGNGLSSWSF